jgi:hypothetical protein
MTEIEQPLHKQFAANLHTFRYHVTSAPANKSKLASVAEE